MIYYTSNRKYKSFINKLNSIYNETKNKSLNNPEKLNAHYNNNLQKWYLDESVVDFRDYLPYGDFKLEDLERAKNQECAKKQKPYMELEELRELINFKMEENIPLKKVLKEEYELYNKYTIVGDVCEHYNKTVYLTNSGKAKDKLRIYDPKQFAKQVAKKISKKDLKNCRVEIIGELSYYDKTGEIQLEADEVNILNERTKYQKKIDTYAKKLLEFNCKYPNWKPKNLNEINPKNIGLIAGESNKVETDFKNTIDREQYNITSKRCILSAQNISNLIKEYNQEKKVDCICILRGGGSIYDLLDFHSPILIEEMILSEIPVVTAIGHADDKPFCYNYSAKFCYDCPAEKFITPTKLAEMFNILAKNKYTQKPNLTSQKGILGRILSFFK